MSSTSSSTLSTHAGPVKFLYNQLEPREFEKLLYRLFNQHIAVKTPPYYQQYDHAQLMQGVGEKGRDVSLSLAGKSVGLIQCKRVQTNLSDTVCAQEIIKFALNVICSPGLITDRNQFTYYLTASTGFSEKAIDLLSTLNQTINERPELQNWTEAVIRVGKVFQQNGLSYAGVEQDLKEILSCITVRTLIPVDLDSWLSQDGYHSIAKHFFPKIVLVSSASTELLLPKITDEQVINQLYHASSDLQTWPSTFDKANDMRLEREETTKLLTWIDEPLIEDEQGKLAAPVALLVGGAGYGKTTVMQDLLNRLHKQQIPVLGIKADRLILSKRSDLEQELHLSQSIDELLKQVAVSHKRVVVLVDQLDALSQSLSANRLGILTYNRLIEQLATLPNIRLVISCRLYDLEYDPALTQYQRRFKVELQLLSESQVDSVLERLSLSRANLPGKLIELLRVPLHLNLFCQVYKAVVDLATLTTLQDLYHEIWSQKILNVPPTATATADQVRSLLETMARRMYDVQEIHIPYRQVESDHKAALAYLSSESLLTRAGTKLEFFHQSFFDYVFARSFVDRGFSLTNDIKGKNKHQGLFIRSKVRQVLTYLREVDEKQYEREVIIVLTDSDYRFHLKLLTLQHLASQAHPLPEEFQLAQRVIQSNSLLWEVFIEAVNTAEWFRYITKNCGELIALTDIKNYNRLRQLCRRVQYQCPYDVVQFLRRLPDTPERNELISDVLITMHDFSNSETIQLFEEANRLNPLNDLWFYSVMEHAIPTQPIWVAAQIEKRLLVSIDQMDVSYHAKLPVGQHSHQLIDTLEKLHESAPYEAFTICLTILTAFLQKSKPFKQQWINLDLISDSAFNRYNVGEVTHQDQDTLLNKLLTWLNAWLDQGTTEAIDQIKELLSADYLTLASLALRGVIHQPASLADAFFGKISSPFWLAEHDWLDHEFFSNSVRDALQACFPHWSEQQQQTVVVKILSINIRFEFYHKRPKESKLFPATGITQYELLNLLPQNFLAQNYSVNRRYQELHRKFGHYEPRQPSRRSLITVGGHTLSARAYEQMSDADWINSFIQYNSQKKREWEKPDELSHAQQFEQRVREHPERFVPLIETIVDRPDVPDLYVCYGLDGLVESYDLDVFKQLFIKSLHRSHDEVYIFRMVHLANRLVKRRDYDESVFSFLEILSLTGAEQVLVEDNLFNKGFNTIRGSVLFNLYQWLHNELYTERCFRIVEQIAIDGQLATRAVALHQQAQFNHYDKARSLQLFLQLCAGYEVPLAEWSINALQYHIHTDFVALIPFLEKGLETEAPKTLHSLAQIVMVAYRNNYSNSGELLECYVQKGEDAVDGALDIALTDLTNPDSGIRDRCTSVAFRFLSYRGEKVNQAYISAFRKYEVADFIQLLPFLEAYAQSEAGRKRDSEFYSYLLKCVKDYPNECIRLASFFDRHLGPDFTHRYLQHEPLNVILQAYNQFEDYVGKTPEKEQAMDVFDRMLMNPAYRNLMNSITEKLN